MSEIFETVAKALYGLEKILAEELLALGADDLQIARRMVSFTGDKKLLYKANFHCRTTLHILKLIYHFKAKDAGTVYKGVEKVEWEKYLPLDKAFAIDSVIYSEDFDHSKFVACRMKDAIVDYFIEKFKEHPSVCVSNPGSYVNIHISRNDYTLSVGSSGESLHKHGYRVDQTGAPLGEVLIAGMILKTGWEGESNFVDLMYGSGTLLIGAVMIALNITPGIHRREFAFQKWVDYNEELFDRVYNDESGGREFVFRRYSSDISQAAVDIALESIHSAGLVRYIDLKVKPFQQYTEVPRPGVSVINPPYGKRISFRDLLGLYNMIGGRSKHVFTGYRAWILSYKDKCFDKIGLHPSEKIKLMNDSLEREYCCYELFKGTNKSFKKVLSEDGEEYPRRSEGSFEHRGNDRPNSRTGRVDRPERRFAAAHNEDDEERFASIPRKRIFGEDRGEDRPVHKKFVDAPVREPIRSKEERPTKIRYRNEDDRKKGSDDHRRDGKRPSNKSIKPIKRRGYDDYED